MMGGPPGSATRMPALTVAPELSDSRPRDYSGIIKGGPRQEITGPAYQDQTRPSPMVELHSQAHHAAEFNRSVNQQRDMRGDYLQGIWRRPHEQPASNLPQPNESIPTTRPTNSPHNAAAGLPQPNVVSSQSPQMMMTTPPYSQPLHAQNNLGQGSMRGKLKRRVDVDYLSRTNASQDQLVASAAPRATTISLGKCGRRAHKVGNPATAATRHSLSSNSSSSSSSSNTRHNRRLLICVSPAAKCNPICNSLPWVACSMLAAKACTHPTRHLDNTCNRAPPALVDRKHGLVSTRRLNSISSNNGGLANSNRLAVCVGGEPANLDRFYLIRNPQISSVCRPACRFELSPIFG
jgi:hypothetical protein